MGVVMGERREGSIGGGGGEAGWWCDFDGSVKASHPTSPPHAVSPSLSSSSAAGSNHQDHQSTTMTISPP